MISDIEETPLNFNDPNFNKAKTTTPIFPNSNNPIHFLPNFQMTIKYFKSNDEKDLPFFLSTFQIKPFIIIHSLEYKKNEAFRFLIINGEYCLIISIVSRFIPLYFTDFLKSVFSARAIFPRESSKQNFENFFHNRFNYTQYYDDNTIISNLLVEIKKEEKYKDFFECTINHDIDIEYTLYEAISQSIRSVFAYFVNRHDFFKYAIKVNNQVDFSQNYILIAILVQNKEYEIKVVFHKTASMLFIYKSIFTETNSFEAYKEKRYNETKIFEPVLNFYGVFHEQSRKRKSITLVYEYAPLFKLDDKFLSDKTKENCLISLLKKMDSIHSKNYIINGINVRSVFFTVDNSIFFANCHQITQAQDNFYNDMYQFGQLVKSIGIKNKYLNEITLCPENYFLGKKPNDYYICFPVTQYFLIRLKPKYYYKTKDEIFQEELNSDENLENKEDKIIKFDGNRKDNKTLLVESKWNDVGVLKTLLFCYSNVEHDIDRYIDKLPSPSIKPDIYLILGEEMLDFDEQKAMKIFNRVIRLGNVDIQNKVFFIIGKFYFIRKKYQTAVGYFIKIQKIGGDEINGKMNYIIGRMYKLQLLSFGPDSELFNYRKYYQTSLSLNYWRAIYQEGLIYMNKGEYEKALINFDKAIKTSQKDEREEIELFGLLGISFYHICGMIAYYNSICYQKMGRFEEMKESLERAEALHCRLSYAALAYYYLMKDSDYHDYKKSYEYLLKAFEFLPLNFELIIITVFKIIDILIAASKAEESLTYLNFAIQLYANSQQCEEKHRNFLIKNIQVYSILAGGQLSEKGVLGKAFPCFALSAAFGYPAGFIGLSSCYLFGKGVQRSVISALLCLKEFVKLYDPRDEINDDIANIINESISKYPVYIQRIGYFQIGSALYKVSKSPYIPFDFLIKAASLIIPDNSLSDVKYIDELNLKIQIIMESIIDYYQYKVPDKIAEEDSE